MRYNEGRCAIDLNAALEQQLAEVLENCTLESTSDGGRAILLDDGEDLNGLTPEKVRDKFDQMTDAQFLQFVIDYFEAEYEENNYFSARLQSIKNVYLAVQTSNPEVIATPDPESWRTDRMTDRAKRGRRLGDSHLRLVRRDIPEGTEEEKEK